MGILRNKQSNKTGKRVVKPDTEIDSFSKINSEIESEKEIKNEKKVELTTKPIEKTEVVPNQKKQKREKSVCRIVYASPNYFIILKNGEEIRINKKNNYKRGEDIFM